MHLAPGEINSYEVLDGSQVMQKSRAALQRCKENLPLHPPIRSPPTLLSPTIFAKEKGAAPSGGLALWDSAEAPKVKDNVKGVLHAELLCFPCMCCRIPEHPSTAPTQGVPALRSRHCGEGTLEQMGQLFGNLKCFVGFFEGRMSWNLKGKSLRTQHSCNVEAGGACSAAARDCCGFAVEMLRQRRVLGQEGPDQQPGCSQQLPGSEHSTVTHSAVSAFHFGFFFFNTIFT